MRVAFIFNSLSNTGTNIATRDLIYQLIKSYDLDIDVFYFDALEDELVINSVEKQIKFFDRIDFSNYNIVHSSNFRSDVYVFLNKTFLFNGKQTKYVTSVHSIIEEDFTFTHGKLVSKLIAPFWLRLKRNNDAIFVSSDSMLRHYQVLFQNRNVNTIEYGRSIEPIDGYQIPKEDIESILDLKSKFKTIGTVGSLIRRKNYSSTISLLKNHHDYAWICLGAGDDLQNLMALVKENSLENRVLFLGFKKDSRPYYQYFDMFFHPSRNEGFPLVVIDAMSHKVPMLLANLSIYKSIIKEDMASYFELDDELSLLRAFSKIASSQTFAANAIENCFLTYNTKFSLEEYGRKHYQVFQCLIK